MSKIIFVCTGNVFRSMSAEFSMRAAVSDDKTLSKTLRFASAGTHARHHKKIRRDVMESLQKHGIDPASHVSRPLTQKIIDEADLVVAMSIDHKNFIKKEFNHHAPLFYEISRGREETMLDLLEAIPDFRDKPEESRHFVEQTIDTIVGERQAFLKNLPRFLNRK